MGKVKTEPLCTAKGRTRVLCYYSDLFRLAEIWLLLMLVLIYCEKKILFFR
jgi:hypothetical protein